MRRSPRPGRRLRSASATKRPRRLRQRALLPRSRARALCADRRGDRGQRARVARAPRVPRWRTASVASRHRREALRRRRGVREGARIGSLPRSSTRRRSTASTTTSGRSRCRGCWRCASRTGSSSRSGTSGSSTMSRSPPRRRSASRIASAFYDQTGAIRDMIQSHLLQVLAFVAMEPPSVFAADRIRAERRNILESIQPPLPATSSRFAALGQYGPADGKPGYAETAGVAAGSTTETFASLKIHFDNWRWAGTPFYLRTGKRLAAKRTEVVVQFKAPPTNLFRTLGREVGERVANADRLIIEIAPTSRVRMRFAGRSPGADGSRSRCSRWKRTSAAAAAPRSRRPTVRSCSMRCAATRASSRIARRSRRRGPPSSRCSGRHRRRFVRESPTTMRRGRGAPSPRACSWLAMALLARRTVSRPDLASDARGAGSASRLGSITSIVSITST